jgi:hypothetical protein
VGFLLCLAMGGTHLPTRGVRAGGGGVVGHRVLIFFRWVLLGG